MADTFPSLTLQADLGIEHVAELKAALAPHLAANAPLVLDGSRVRRVHSAGLQLLHAFVRERADAGHGTTIHAPSSALADAARLLALDGALEQTFTQAHASTTGEPA